MNNFGDILDSIYGVASNKFASDKEKCGNIIKESIKIIKIDEVLSDQFTIYNNLRDTVILESDVNDYIGVNVESMKKHSKKDIRNANLKLEKYSKTVGGVINNTKLNESISNLLSLSDSSKNVNSLHESKKIVKGNLINNTIIEEVDRPSVPIALVAKIISKKYNEKYSDLTETDKSLLKTILEHKDGNEGLFNTYKKEATSLLEVEIINNDESSLHSNLKKTYNKVIGMEFISENSINDISKLHYLISGLK
tara:strand:+ start:24484 stop:25239 length:756 start_codon:yes stop_codon:yes gene_type:complete